MWKERYNSDPAIIGKKQILNGVPHTIVGVAPENFFGTFVGYAIQFWVPISMQEKFEPGGYKLEDRGAHWIEGFVRLKPGVSLQKAQSEIAAVCKPIIQRRTAAEASSSFLYGSRHSTAPPFCCRRWGSRSRWSAWFC
jgi:hypothetical protein